VESAAFALSFGSKEEQAQAVVSPFPLAVRVIEHLCQNWDLGVELYNVNVPMRSDVERRSVHYAQALPKSGPRGVSMRSVRPSTREGAPAKGFGLLPSWILVRFDDRGTSSCPSRERYFQWSTELSDIKKESRL